MKKKLYKIRITGVLQGTKQQEDGSYNFGFKTKYGSIWVVTRKASWFLRNNKHILALMKEGYIESEDIIGRYLWVSEKAKESVHEGEIFTHPEF